MILCNSSVQFSRSVVPDSLRPHESQHTMPTCPSPTPRVYSNSRPLSRWCHLAISSSVVPCSFCLQSLPASESFPMNQLFASGCQSIGVSASASVLPMNTQDWSPLRWTGWTSLQSKGLSRVFSNTSPITSWQIDGEMQQCHISFSWAPKSMPWLQPWNLKMLTPWKKSYVKPRQCFKKQRHNFANKGP